MQKIISIMITLIIFTAGSAFSLPFQGTDLDIDFRDWTGADGWPSATFGSVTATAFNSGTTNPQFLYQDSTDGLGVRGGEHDEIDIIEYLRVEFSAPLDLYGFGVTDLFGAPDGGGRDFGEMGFARFYDNSYINIGEIYFQGINSIGSNGEQYVNFAVAGVSSAVFFAHPMNNDISNNEFSVAGLNTVAPVPEPATMLLFGTGLLGLAGLRLRKKK